ncbi:MAG: hypothetical protein IT518_10325 [Burkholderiales bacterium]|nr:hypothetical protein [Burkholderiales bacterium]
MTLTRLPATSSASSAAISNAASSPMGRLSQTKYYLSDLPSKLTIIRRHHPLETKELELLSGGKTWVVLRLADGSALKILRRWTDADGAVCTELAGHSQLALGGLRELLALLERLRARAPGDVAVADEKMTSPNQRMGDVDVQANATGAPRRGASGPVMGGVSRGAQARGHAAACTVDGAHGGATYPGAENEAGGGR